MKKNSKEGDFMKLKLKLLSVFVLIILLGLSVTSFVAFKATEKAVVENAISVMQNDLTRTIQQIDLLHNKAKSDVVLAVHNPAFQDYFNLPETKAGNKYDENGVLTFTQKQTELKNNLDDWTLFIQSRFTILETCIIDETGQEHSRITNGEIAPASEFSDEEEDAGFFAGAFEVGKDEVYLAYPYMSADAFKWVFAYTTPVVLADGSKPAIYHFEMPISLFQNQVKSQSTGRTFVLDPSGILIADSEKDISIDIKPGMDPEDTEQLLADYMPPANSISNSPQFAEIIEAMKAGKDGSATYTGAGVTYYVAYKPLPTFGWSIAMIKSYDELLQGKSSLVALKKNIFMIVLTALIIAIVVIFIVSESITRPVNKLKSAADQITDGKLQLPAAKGNDEISQLTASMEMLITAFKTAKQQNEPIKKVKK